MNPSEWAMIDAQHLAAAKNASPMVAITFHFVADRLHYLDEVIGALAGYPVSKRKIVVVTNTTEKAEQDSLWHLFGKHKLAADREARLAVVADLPHPYLLTWAHKRLITDEFLAFEGEYTHFAYIEDDERLSFENFAYFLAAREMLRDAKLLPGFLRTEWSTKRQLYVNQDNIEPIVVADRPFVCRGDYILIEPPNPYCGAFILDRELALEYVRSRSFDPYLCSSVIPIPVFGGVRERAAMGLTFEAPPRPFVSRVVVPVSLRTRTAPSCALLPHLPNNYADVATTLHGKIDMNELFKFTRNQLCPCGSGRRYKHCHGAFEARDANAIA
jgi:SEC-C motif